jgi:hypothetical protein
MVGRPSTWLAGHSSRFEAEPTQSVASQPRGWSGWPTLEPFDLWFGPTWSTCHKRSCSDTIFGRIPNGLVIS